MSLHYVIDGYNLIHHPLFTPGHKNKDCRMQLLEHIRIKRLCGSAKNKITVVFDGYPPRLELRQNIHNIEVIFAKEDAADARIKKIIEQSPNLKNIVVVSDDKEIRFFVSSTGARAMLVEEFMGHKEETPESLKKKDLLKPELSYSQIDKINQELRKIWLK